MIDEFDKEHKYRLYRNLSEIIHPTISKRNISNYKIVLNEKLVPVHVFYPKKVSNIKSVIIYIHGVGSVTGNDSTYSALLQRMALLSNKLVIGIEYRFGGKYKYPYPVKDCYKVIKYLYDNIESVGLNRNNIFLMGDSIGANIIEAINIKALKKKDFQIGREVLFYPILNQHTFDNSVHERLNDKVKLFFNKYSDLDDENIYPLKNNDFSKFPKTLIFTGDADPFRVDGIELYEKLRKNKVRAKHINFEFLGHGFLNVDEDGFNKNLTKEINKFLVEEG